MTEQITDTETPWVFVKSYFSDGTKTPATKSIKHQLESFNDFITYQLPKTINMFNTHEPIVSKDEYNADLKINPIEIYITFKNFHMENPQIYELNGVKVDMFPNKARLRNYTYSSSMFLDVHAQTIIRTGDQLENRQIFNKVIKNVHIGKMPIMLNSSICMLNKYKTIAPDLLGECKYDTGGYFIINGSEKVVITQERAAENKVYVYPVKNNTKYIMQAELKSVPSFKCISPKQINVALCAKNNGFGHPIVIQIPRIKQHIPVFILFRALGVVADKDICNIIMHDVDDILKHAATDPAYKRKAAILEALQASIIDANKYLTHDDALQYLTNHVIFNPPPDMDKETGLRKKQDFAADILQNDLFPHCATKPLKIFYLGHMILRLLTVHCCDEPYDDRDSYLNKRLDLTGTLLNNLFRTNFNKFVKDMQRVIIREINTGSWRNKGVTEYENIINDTNISKIFKSTTIESSIKGALSTGNFTPKNMSANTNQNAKVGVAQMLNRLNYISGLSHLRRVSTPYNKSDKLVPPRKLHGTSYGFMCPAETPEGQSVGVVKNLAYMCGVTIPADPTPIHEWLTGIDSDSGNAWGYTSLDYIMGTTAEDTATMTAFIYERVKVFLNGAWIGVVNRPYEFYLELKNKKLTGAFNIYTSVVFNIPTKEIAICTDGGRVVQPLFRVCPQTQRPYFDARVVSAVNAGHIKWDDMLIPYQSPTDPEIKWDAGIIEYIDADEKNTVLIATSLAALIARTPETAQWRYTHCEIHASSIYGVTAACIPFPEMNQSPRNAYQSAQAKQAAGTYVTNYFERMDKTSYHLVNPQRPLVETRLMNILQLHKIPWGANIRVAIMTFSGYNQEDSIIMKKSFAQRGGFDVITFHTEKDEDKNRVNGNEEIRCKPNPAITKKMKLGIDMCNYSKLNDNGFVPENTLIKNNDIIIAKVTPIKENRNDENKVHKYNDLSKTYRSSVNEETYVDKNYMNKNGDGYNFAKVRLRTLRKPGIGDKFSSRAGQKGTVGIILDDRDMPFTADGVTPDIIINPHAIPSRMTIAQLMETLMSKVLAELGSFGDGTPFGGLSVDDVAEMLAKMGKESYGNELLHNPFTGEQHDCSVFMGHVFYHRLKHMVNDKIHSRDTGPVVNLTRQPMEGRARDGGLRFGEMERDATIAHGMAGFTRERLYQSSDRYAAHICSLCGMRAIYNIKAGIHECRVCNNTTAFKYIEIPYACKLIDQELQAMNVSMRYVTAD